MSYTNHMQRFYTSLCVAHLTSHPLTLLVALALATLAPQAIYAQTGKPKSASNSITVAFYNSENLFDSEDDPTIDDAEYLPTSELKWDATRYQAKLVALGRVIDTLGSAAGPDILGVCEIENKRVLQDLAASALLAPKGYEIVHRNSPDRRGIDVGMLYKKGSFLPFRNRWFRVADPADTAFRTRDVLLVSGTIGTGKKQDTLHVFVNHWPSRRGGPEASAVKRALAAAVVRQATDSILARNSKAKILAMGDLNDEPTDPSLTDVLKAGPKPTTAWPAGFLWNTMWDLKATKKGSHYYRGEFSMLDQIIVSEGLAMGKGLRVKDAGGNIYNPTWVAQQEEKYKGAPFRTYIGKKYTGGFSDHFSVFITLER